MKDELEAEMRRQHPSHKYVFVELTDSTSTDLSCVVVKQKRAEPETYSLWKDADKATCDVVLTGKQPHKGIGIVILLLHLLIFCLTKTSEIKLL